MQTLYWLLKPHLVISPPPPILSSATIILWYWIMFILRAFFFKHESYRAVSLLFIKFELIESNIYKPQMLASIVCVSTSTPKAAIKEPICKS